MAAGGAEVFLLSMLRNLNRREFSPEVLGIYGGVRCEGWGHRRAHPSNALSWVGGLLKLCGAFAVDTSTPLRHYSYKTVPRQILSVECAESSRDTGNLLDHREPTRMDKRIYTQTAFEEWACRSTAKG